MTYSLEELTTMSTYAKDLIISALKNGDLHTVASLVELTDCSETFVRDFLKVAEGVEVLPPAVGTKSKRFCINVPKPSPIVPEYSDPIVFYRRSQAKLDPIIEKMAAEGEELDATPLSPTPKAKRPGPLNPQPMINKKRAAIESAGGELHYENREWKIIFNGVAHIFTSKEFSLLPVGWTLPA
jgi:hypothetical protein